MQIKRSIEKIPGGMMLVPLFLGALCHTFSPGAGHGGVNKIKRDGNGTA